jgi:hypothetical protein
MLAVAGDRSAFWRIAVANKILLYVAEPLREQLNPSELAAVADYKFRTFQINSTLLRESLAVCATLQAIQTPFIYMKGPLQQRLVYGDFFTRPVADIDILLPRRDHRRAAKSLEALSYHSASTSLWWRLFLGEEHLVRKGTHPTTIDLHYRLQQPGSPPRAEPANTFKMLRKFHFAARSSRRWRAATSPCSRPSASPRGSLIAKPPPPMSAIFSCCCRPIPSPLPGSSRTPEPKA